MKKIVSILTIILLLSLIVNISYVNAATTRDGIDSIINGMKNASTLAQGDTQTGIANKINDMIGLLQIAGSGIAIIMITILGIKYILASPSEKAETKKLILPMLIGCVLLFGAVNLVAAVAELTGVFGD